MVDPALATQATVLTFCPKPGLPQRHTACRFWWSQREGFQSQVHVYLLKLLTNDSNNQPFFAPRDIVNLFPHQALNFIPCKNSGSQCSGDRPSSQCKPRTPQCWGCCPWSRGCFQSCLNNLETSILSLPAQIARSSTCPYPLPQCSRIPHQFNFSIKFLQWPQPCLHQLQPRPSFDTISEHTKPA